MAVGGITYDSNAPAGGTGGTWVSTGYLEADTTLRAFALTNGWITDLQLTPQDDAASVQCAINENTSGTATAGTAAITTNLATNTIIRFRMEYVQ